MRGLSCWSLALTLATLLTPGALSAQTNEQAVARLTDRQHWLVAGSAGGAYTEGARDGSWTSWFVRAAPEATYFVRDRIGVGLALNGGIIASTIGDYDVRSVELGAGVTGVFEIALSPRLGLLFRPFLGYIQQWSNITTVNRPSAEQAATAPGALSQAQAQVDAVRRQQLGSLRTALGLELLVHLSPRVALAAGPRLWFDVLFDDGAHAAGDRTPVESRPASVLNRYRLQLGLGVGLLFGL